MTALPHNPHPADRAVPIFADDLDQSSGDNIKIVGRRPFGNDLTLLSEVLADESLADRPQQWLVDRIKQRHAAQIGRIEPGAPIGHTALDTKIFIVNDPSAVHAI